MKRHNHYEASIVPCTLSWSLISFLLVLSFFSCSCRNKTNSVQLNPVDSSSISGNESNISGNLGDSKSFEHTPKSQVTGVYNDVIAAVKSKPGYSLFTEFLERGKYSDVLNRLDLMEFIILAPSDGELNKLDNATLTQLIYPEMPDQSNLNFMIRHVAIKLKDAPAADGYKSMTGKNIKLEANTLIFDGNRLPVQDEAQVNPNVKVLFITQYLN